MKKVSYRNRHIIIIVFVLFVLIPEIFSLTGFWKVLNMAAYVIILNLLMGKYEEKDELTRQLLARATEITFYLLLAVLFVSAIIIDNVKSLNLSVNIYFYSVFGAIAVRSFIFLWLDKTPKGTEE